ncbi:uncharacterized protein [Lepeophtheirus salmonis]|uniref:Uncharacterized protein n=1 Tax=Lepeophtheirus salmonis TaxID=72036 RepID=A0A0K2SV23_LEPSM|nr:uncharacterized protein LOC121128189 [Lepeophtheirus salmonis]
MDFISTSLSFLSLWSFSTEKTSRNCTQLQDCGPVDWLLKNRQSVPSSVGNISELLRNINCGYNENGPKVYCSDEISEFDDEFDEIYDDYDEEASGDYDYNNSSQLRGGVIDGLSMDGSTCQGSAVCYILKTDSFYVSKVHRRRRSISGSVFRVEVVGNCCWEAYERKRFRGKFESYKPGFDTYPEILVKSIRKVHC